MLAREKDEVRLGNAFLLVLVAYFLLQILVRTYQPGALELDEAEQVYNAQRIWHGYDGQPPLYTWLQWAAFQLFGVSLLGLSALKNALLFILCASTYQLAKPFVGTVGAVAATSSLILLGPIGWESQLDRSHSVLATTLAALSLQSYFMVLRYPSALRRAMLGLVLGLGMQSKYNFAVFGAGLFIASIAVREHRLLFWTRGVWVTVLIAALCLLPHGLWFADNTALATEDTLRKMSAGEQHADNYVYSVASGLGRLALGIVAFASPFWILFALAIRPCWKSIRLQLASPSARFFLYLFSGMLGCLIGLALIGKLGNVKGRWLQPLLFSLPLALFVVFPETARQSVFRRLICIAGIAAVSVLAALALRPYAMSAAGKHLRMHQPYPELVAEVARRFTDVRILVGQDRHVAGNLRFQHTALSTWLLDDVLGGKQEIEGRVLILVHRGTEAGWQQRLMNVYPTVAILEQGQIGVRSGQRIEETLLFDYVLVRIQREQDS